MEECASPIQEPCDIYGDVYKYLHDEPSGSTVSLPVSSVSSSSSSSKTPLQSMLVTGFGLRHWDSLERALLDDEQRRQMLMAQYDKNNVEFVECESVSSASTRIYSDKSQSRSVISATSGRSSVKSPTLEYLLGLDEPLEEYGEEQQKKPKQFPSAEVEADEDATKRMTTAMRKARKYLREHKIFEFFQFLIAHLLSEVPDNPIQFLIDFLDRCLLYRSGFGNPPLLFEKPHIEQLFYLMDRMRTGFIEMEQYETGMKTLGICSYDKHPPLTTNGMVTKDLFVEEAYECLTDLFVDMVRSRGGQVTPPSVAGPPPTAAPPSFASQ